MAKIILTGDRPTGRLHLGHFVGSLRRRVELQNSGEFDEIFIMIADAQALTDNADNPEKVRQNIIEVALDYLSVGLDPAKSTLFIQSQVAELCELAFYYMNLVTVQRLQRNPTVKAEIALRGFAEGAAEGDTTQRQGIPVGFFTYPISQASDITAFRATTVPVGEDQRQHLELTRNLAQRFNSRFGETFVVPEPVILKETAKIYDLQEPTSKMSKSAASDKGLIKLLDTPKVTQKKIKSAVTDDGSVIAYDREVKPGVSNLMQIYSVTTGKSYEAIEQEFAGQGYGSFKTAVGESVVELLRPIREETDRLLADKAYLESVYRAGAEKAAYVANRTLSKVYKKVGFLAR